MSDSADQFFPEEGGAQGDVAPTAGPSSKREKGAIKPPTFGMAVAIAVVAYFIASSDSEWAGDIMAMVENAWGLFGAAFGPVVILSLFWKRLNYAGAVAGIVVGALVDGLWLAFLTGSTGIYEILPGFVAGFLAAVLVSLATPKPSAEVEAIYARATDPSIDD